MAKILIIEDNAQDQKIMKLNLIKGGYKNLIFASTGEDGIVKAKSEKIDLIILDINLPQMNGVEVQMALKRDPTTRHIPILFTTNLLKKGELGDGMDKFLAKSSLQKDLIKSVKMLLGSA